mgnify:CR=1 FL=1
MIEATVLLLAVLIAFLLSSTSIAVALGFTSLIYFYYFTVVPMTLQTSWLKVVFRAD